MVIAEKVRQTVIEDKPKVNREDFGPGLAGQQAYEIIRTGVICEGFDVITNSEGQEEIIPCKNAAKVVINFDTPIVNDLVHVASCKGHVPTIKRKVTEDCKAFGNTPSFGINGWGRD